MRYLMSSILVFITFVNGVSQVDSSFAKKISISGFCLCETSLTSLRNTVEDLKMVTLEEMDHPKNCYGHDSRFTNGEGYHSSQYPGLIFQIGNESDYIGKIRLTKDFKGKLPNGSIIELKSLKLRDLFEIYPEFKDKWMSRGCSEYWRFSNDTISFYVKIDKNIQPQFPINESYYYDKPIEGAEIVLSCYSVFNKQKAISLFDENDPLYFIDSIRVNKGVLIWYEPSEIAFVNVYKDENAIRIAGKEAKNGAIYLITKDYARDKYWTFLRSKSIDYRNLVTDLNKEENIIYILNDKRLEKDFEKDLFQINEKNLIEIVLVSDRKLKKSYKASSDQTVFKIRTQQKSSQ